MTDREYRAACALIKRLTNKWQKLLGLSHVDIQVYFHRGPIPDEEQFAMANTSSLWEYQFANINWNVGAAMHAEDSLEEAVVHELVHVMLAEMQHNDGQEHVEHVTTSISKAFLRVGSHA